MTQLDLFAEQHVDEREQWGARFERTPWVAPYDCGLGPAGTVVAGWSCPACGKVEVNEFLLNLNHGYDPTTPGRIPYARGFGETCVRLELLASQERARAAKAAREQAVA